MDKQSVYEDRLFSRQAMTSTFYSNQILQSLPQNKVNLKPIQENQSKIPNNYSQPPLVPPPNEYQYIYRNQKSNSQLGSYIKPKSKYHSSQILQKLLNYSQYQQPESDDLRMNSTQFKRFMEQRNSLNLSDNQKPSLLKPKNKRFSYQGSMERESRLQQMTLISEDEDALFQKVHIQPKTSMEHDTRVNISQLNNRMKKVMKQKQTFNAYSSQGMVKSFSVNRKNDQFFDLKDQGRNTNIKAFTNTGYSTSWMIHNGQKQKKDNDKPSLVIIRQKPRCLSSLGDEREMKEVAGNTRYQDLKKARVQTSCSAPIQQEDENYDSVVMDISTKENNQQKSNNIWNSQFRPGTQMGSLPQTNKPMSSALKLRARDFNNVNKLPSSTDPMQQTQMSFNSVNFQNPNKTMYIDREKNRIEKQLEDMKFKMVKMKEKNQMIVDKMRKQSDISQFNNKREVKFEIIREDQEP